ncbi:MAG: amino acid ABC transporter permease [Jiangellales bacterium]
MYWAGFLTTVSLSLLAGLVAFSLGTLLAAFRVSPFPPLQALGTFYVEVFRNTPLTVVWFFMVFALPLIDIALPSFFVAGVLALGLYTAAFVCEAVRSGINSVSAGQAEAARAIGLTFTQTLRLVVLPQAFRTVVPPLGNVWIAMVKNSSIGAAFAVTELTAVATRLVNVYPADVIAIFAGSAVGYLIITLSSGLLLGVVERRVVILR